MFLYKNSIKIINFGHTAIAIQMILKPIIVELPTFSFFQIKQIPFFCDFCNKQKKT